MALFIREEIVWDFHGDVQNEYSCVVLALLASFIYLLSKAFHHRREMTQECSQM